MEFKFKKSFGFKKEEEACRHARQCPCCKLYFCPNDEMFHCDECSENFVCQECICLDPFYFEMIGKCCSKQTRFICDRCKKKTRFLDRNNFYCLKCYFQHVENPSKFKNGHLKYNNSQSTFNQFDQLYYNII